MFKICSKYLTFFSGKLVSDGNMNLTESRLREQLGWVPIRQGWMVALSARGLQICSAQRICRTNSQTMQIHPKYIPNTSYPLGSSGAGFCVETSLYWSMKAQARLTKSDDLKVICKCAYTEKVERWRSTAYTNHWPPACITTTSNQTKQFHLCICRDSAEMRLHYFISWLRPDVAPCETPSLVASAKENTLACQGSRNCTNFDGFRWISMDSGNQKLVREWFDRSPNETQEVTWRCSKAAWDVKIDLPHCRFNWRVAYKSKLSGTRDPSMSYSYGNVWIRCVFM
jgi:hypothetical protein